MHYSTNKSTPITVFDSLTLGNVLNDVATLEKSLILEETLLFISSLILFIGLGLLKKKKELIKGKKNIKNK